MIKLRYIVLIGLFQVVSCQKEVVSPSQTDNEYNNPNDTPYSTAWSAQLNIKVLDSANNYIPFIEIKTPSQTINSSTFDMTDSLGRYSGGVVYYEHFEAEFPIQQTVILRKGQAERSYTVSINESINSYLLIWE